ncbi:hypothetical protein VPHK251G3_0086 [Vibrio phage K251 g3]
MGMSYNSAIKLFKRVGIKPITVKTGSPEWVRVFIEYKGCRYARASFKDNQLFNIKWYDRGYTDELNETDRLKTAIALMKSKGIVLSDGLWDLLVDRSEALRDEAYRIKLAKREHLEEMDLARGAKKRKKRPKIKKPLIRNYLTLEGV